MGAWVKDDEIEAVLNVCRKAHWHTFQLLTKNAPRLLQFEFPPNVWVGASVPPTFMFEKRLSQHQQVRMLRRTLSVLADVQATVKWMSVEPLSFDMAEHFEGARLHWAVIGAASSGRTIYQPDPAWVERLLAVFDQAGTPVFFKGNLRDNAAAMPWREEWPRSA